MNSTGPKEQSIAVESAELRATEKAKRKLIFGVGNDDANDKSKININFKKYNCPFYRKWKNMLLRCYSVKYQENQPTYIGCTVCDDWLTFSNFKSWMITQDWQGKQLDKDLLMQGNKIYSPETCLFVSQEINKLLNDSAKSKGGFPQGVCWHKREQKFTSQLSVNGKAKSIGYFNTAELASVAYKKAKYTLIAEIARTQPEPLSSALLNYKL